MKLFTGIYNIYNTYSLYNKVFGLRERYHCSKKKGKVGHFAEMR